MYAFPTETEIAAADFSGDTAASIIAIARSFDREHEGTKIEDGVRRLFAAGFADVFVSNELNPTDLCPLQRGITGDLTGWRVPAWGGRNTERRRFRDVVVTATKGGRTCEVRISQVQVWERLRGREVRTCRSTVTRAWLPTAVAA